MRVTKSQLRRIIKEEVARALHEQNTSTLHGAPGNPAPPSDSNWSDFAAALDIGVLDLEAIGYEFGYENFHDLDQSISPASLAERDARAFVDAAKEHSLRAEDMSDNDILAAASGFGGHASRGAVPKTRRYGRGIGRE